MDIVLIIIVLLLYF